MAGERERGRSREAETEETNHRIRKQRGAVQEDMRDERERDTMNIGKRNERIDGRWRSGRHDSRGREKRAGMTSHLVCDLPWCKTSHSWSMCSILGSQHNRRTLHLLVSTGPRRTRVCVCVLGCMCVVRGAGLARDVVRAMAGKEAADGAKVRG